MDIWDRKIHSAIIVMGFVILLFSGCLQKAQMPVAQGGVTGIEIIADPGGRVSVLHPQDLIAFDRREEDGYFDVYTMKEDGSQKKCITCGSLPKNNGNPSWHPSGEYMVFQAQDPALFGIPKGTLGDYFASPGIGIHNNLWIADANGKNFWQLTHIIEGGGTLHPQFSPDGTEMLWGEIEKPGGTLGGRWVMKLADFSVMKGIPQISNVRILAPLALQLYETHGFSPDGEYILFSGIEEGGFYYDLEIYLMNLQTGETTRLTDNDEWDEHAHFTPDGTEIVWTSSEGTPQKKSASWGEMRENPPLLEYWVMNRDGSGRRKLSGFNDTASPDYMGWRGGVGLGDFDFSHDGRHMIAKMRKGTGGEIVASISFARFPRSRFIGVM